MANNMCACAQHCPLSAYHEKACCDQTHCDCWCHTKKWKESAPQTTLGSTPNYARSALTSFTNPNGDSK